MCEGAANAALAVSGGARNARRAPWPTAERRKADGDIILDYRITILAQEVEAQADEGGGNSKNGPSSNK